MRPPPQVDSNDERPAMGDVGAALCKSFVKEGAPRATAASVRHNAHVGQSEWFTPACPAALSSLTPHSSAMLTSLERVVPAQLISITDSTASEVEGVGAVAFGAVLFDSVLRSRYDGHIPCMLSYTVRPGFEPQAS